MKTHGQEKTNFIVINKTADSLYSLIADGQYRATSLGRDTWKSLIGSEASLHLNCTKEGFNAIRRGARARIGIIQGNLQIYCFPSTIGFGTSRGWPYFYFNFNTCGNQATRSPDNGDKNIKAMGYILVQ